jgi:hypothetical protein
MASDLVLPELDVKVDPRTCPKCGSKDFDARTIEGMVHRTCRQCKLDRFGGGALPASSPYAGPSVPTNFLETYKRDPVSEDEFEVVVREYRQPMDPRPSFRTGIPLSTEMDEGEDLSG